MPRHLLQYQARAEPLPTVGETVYVSGWEPHFPDAIDRRYMRQPGAFRFDPEPIPDPVVVPDWFLGQQPDRIPRIKMRDGGWFAFDSEPIPDAPAEPDAFGGSFPDLLPRLRVVPRGGATGPLPTIDAEWPRPVYPNRLARRTAPHGWITDNLDPSVIGPDLPRAFFPDRLNRVRRNPEGGAAESLEPIAAPLAPDFTQPTYPDRLPRRVPVAMGWFTINIAPIAPDDNFDFGYAAPAARFDYAAPASVLDYAAPSAKMEYAAP